MAYPNIKYPKINEALLDETLDYIRKHRKNWNQGWWARFTPKKAGETPETHTCHTALCFAGTAVSLAGGKIRWEEGNRYGPTPATVWEADQVRFPHRPYEPISEAATHILGLTPYEGSILFNGENDLRLLRYIRQQHQKGCLP